MHYLSSKLQPPIYGARVLARDGLVNQLVSAHRKLALIQAPAGFGKTTLLTQWREAVRSTGIRVAWVSLDSGDRDAVQFLAYLRRAFIDAGLGVSDDATPQHHVMRPESLQNLAISLCRDLDAANERILLMLDDYHEVQSPEIDRLVSFLVEHSPSQLQIAIATRNRPFLPLTNWLAQGRLSFINGSLLNFSLEELRQLFGDLLDDSALGVVMARTEGWSIAVQMTLMLLKQKSRQGDLVQMLSAPGIGLSHYLAEQILEHLSPECREFLIDTAILERISSPLADAIRERDDSETILQELHSIEPLVVPVGASAQRWYRHHALFLEFLAPLLHRYRTPHTISTLHSRAASWCVRHGMLRDGIRHACVAGNSILARDLFAEAGGATIGLTAGISLLREIVNLLPHDWINSCAEFKLARCLLLAKEGRLADAYANLGDAKRLCGTTPGEHLRRDTVFIEMILSIYADDVVTDEGIAETERVLTTLPTADYWFRGWVYNRLLLMQYRRGHLTAALVAATRALENYKEADAPYTQFFIYLHIGVIELARGRLLQCYQAYRNARTLARFRFGFDLSMTALVNLLLAEALFERNKRVPAIRLLDAALFEVERYEGWTEIYTSGYLTRCRLAIQQGQLTDAKDILDRSELTAATRELPRLLWRTIIERIELATLAGDYATAERLAAVPDVQILLREPRADTRFTWLEYQSAVICVARLYLYQGNLQSTIDLLARYRETCEADTRPGFTVERHIILFLAHAGLAAHDVALGHLDVVLESISQHGLLKSTLRDAHLFASTLVKLAAHVKSTDLLTRLEHLLHRLTGVAPKWTRSRTGRFSARELDILGHLARGSPNKSIARELKLSERTVKFHLQNIYLKLGAHNRTEAIAMVMLQDRVE
jgi:LuxR family maltose regulon positive regulatory protein